jgi:integral membrane protein (TIGR01906 family)
VRTFRNRAGDTVIGLATAFAIVAVTLPLFLNPVWVAFEQGRAEASAWTGFPEPELRAATDAILNDLVLGPPDFDVAVAGVPVLNERERGHMRDVRGVFIGFFAAAISLAVVALAIHARRRGTDRTHSWQAARVGARWLIVTLAVGGVISFVAFETLFEVFHRIFFAGGSYTFDPATERLVQLFPFRFWQETAIAVGAVCIVLAAIVAVIAARRASPDRGVAGWQPDDDGAATLPATSSPR